MISIHLGSYANYVGAHLWNLDYCRVFGSPLLSEAQLGSEGSRPSPHTLFRRVASASGANAGAGASFTPRAVFCDHVGSVPTAPLSVLMQRDPSRSSTSAPQGYSSDADSLHFAWAPDRISSFTPAPVSAPSAPTAATAPTLPGASWHDVLLPALRPRPRSLCLAPSPHVLESNCTLFAHGASLSAVPSSAGGAGGGGESYLDAVLEALRWHAEDCDSLQGFRIICDADSAWAGVAARILTALRDEYPSAAIIAVAVASPLSLFDPSPRMALPTLWAQSESAPASAATVIGADAFIAPPGGVFTIPASMAAGKLTPAAVAAAHLRRTSSLALLLSAASSAAAAGRAPCLVVPATVPNDPAVVAAFARTHTPCQGSSLAAAASAGGSASAGSNETESDSILAHGGLSSTQRALSDLSHRHPAPAFALLSTAALALALHTLLAPATAPPREESDSGGGLTLGQIVGTLQHRPALAIAGFGMRSGPAPALPGCSGQGQSAGADARVGSKVDGHGTVSNSSESLDRSTRALTDHAPAHAAGLVLFSPLLPATAAEATRAGTGGVHARAVAESVAARSAAATARTRTTASALRGEFPAPARALDKMTGFAVLADPAGWAAGTSSSESEDMLAEWGRASLQEAPVDDGEADARGYETLRSFSRLMGTVAAGSQSRNSVATTLPGPATAFPPAFPLLMPLLCAPFSNPSDSSLDTSPGRGLANFDDASLLSGSPPPATGAGRFYDAGYASSHPLHRCFAPASGAVMRSPALVDLFVASDQAAGFAASADRLASAWKVRLLLQFSFLCTYCPPKHMFSRYSLFYRCRLSPCKVHAKALKGMTMTRHFRFCTTLQTNTLRDLRGSRYFAAYTPDFRYLFRRSSTFNVLKLQTPSLSVKSADICS